MALTARPLPYVIGATESFANLRLSIDGQRYLISSVKYGDSIEPAEIRVNNRYKAGDTAGDYKTDPISIEMPEFEAKRLEANLGSGYGSRYYPCSITGIRGDGSPSKVEFEGFRLTKREGGGAAGNEGTKRTFGAICSAVIVDGIRLVDPDEP